MTRVQFPAVWCASGALNFFGDGWPYHEKLKRYFPTQFDWSGVALVSKTTTLNGREGNMPLGNDLQPTESLPRCIWAHLRKGIALNAVGLSGPPARDLFERGRWQELTEPTQLSFMAVAPTKRERLCELKQFLALLDEYYSAFQAPVVLQINFSCPNVEHEQGELKELITEITEFLDRVGEHGYSAIPKLNALFSPMRAIEFCTHPACYGICMSNTIPFRARIPWLPGESSLQVPWNRLFGRGKPSPLRVRGIGGDGGLSGKPLLPLMEAWIAIARQSGVKCHINACGGILCKRDVDRVKGAGADSISLGSIAFLRPWRVRSVVERAYQVFS
jgi:dihydroorotate dehydrogenase